MAVDPENLSTEMEQININNESNWIDEDEDTHVTISEDVIEDIEVKSEVKPRIKTLKKMQAEMTKVEVAFYQDVHELECKYFQKYWPYFELRRKIVLGEYEPTIEECHFAVEFDSDSEVEMDNGGQDEPMISKVATATAEKVAGIPNFWLRIFQNSGKLQGLMGEYDEPILKHLTDITVEMTEEPMGFTLVFHFSPNDYFTNSILTKTYEMRCDVPKNDPFLFEGFEIVKCKGSRIDWLEGKDVTMQKFEKNQKLVRNNKVRIITVIVNAPSFFNFFASLDTSGYCQMTNNKKISLNSSANDVDNSEAQIDKDLRTTLENDTEIGQYIREKIIPHAVLYYTGEASEDDDEAQEVSDDDEAQEVSDDDEAQEVSDDDKAEEVSDEEREDGDPSSDESY